MQSHFGRIGCPFRPKETSTSAETPLSSVDLLLSGFVFATFPQFTQKFSNLQATLQTSPISMFWHKVRKFKLKASSTQQSATVDTRIGKNRNITAKANFADIPNVPTSLTYTATALRADNTDDDILQPPKVPLCKVH